MPFQFNSKKIEFGLQSFSDTLKDCILNFFMLKSIMEIYIKKAKGVEFIYEN